MREVVVEAGASMPPGIGIVVPMALSSQQNGRSGSSRSRSSQVGSQRRARTRSGSPTVSGTSLRQRSINFTGRNRLPGFLGKLSTRGLIALAVALVIALVLLFVIGGCVRSCNAKRAEEEAAALLNPEDARVALGTSSELTSEFTPILDRNEAFSWIAANATLYEDPRIVELAMREPEAIEFVRNYPESEKTASTWSADASKGVPQIYNWDSRWGGFEYAGLPLAVSGSGPTSLAMAYAGLTGKTDKSPADIAALATTDNLATGDSFMSGELFEREAKTLGLTVTKLDQSTSMVVDAVKEKNVVICLVEAGVVTDQPHWVVIANVHEEDGSVDVFDPTSSRVTSQRWDASTIVVAAQEIYSFGNAATA